MLIFSCRLKTTGDNIPFQTPFRLGLQTEATLAKWSRFNFSFLTNFLLGTEEIAYEEEAFFDRANYGCPEAG